MSEKMIKNPHAGEILKYDFLDELEMSENALALSIKVPPNRIHDIVKGNQPITADIDIRLCRFFGLSEGYFLRLQNAYEIMEAKRDLGETLTNIIPFSIK